MKKINLEALLNQAQKRRAQGPRGRYAPSPTGSLHLGNLRTALYAWLQARLAGGLFILRMEDLDQPRVVDGSAEEILHDLRWLGLTWDEGPYFQSERTEIYDAALDYLRQKDLVFPCYCSRRDIRQAASAPHGPSGPVYPGTCRHLTPEAQSLHQARHPDRSPSFRFRVPDRSIHFEDAIAGPYSQHLANDVGDFVLRRADHIHAYQLAVTVDDALMGITDVLRGADLLDSTPRQIALFQAFDVTPPRFWHVPLMLDSDGERLSKRDGSDSLQQLRNQNLDAPAVIGLLAASLGWVPQNTRLSAQELLQELTLHDLQLADRRSPPQRPTTNHC